MRIIAAILILGSTGACYAHDWYTGTKDPESGFGCCGGSDCAPVDDTEVQSVPGGYVYLPTGEFIEAKRVQQSKDWQFHRCEVTKDQTRCFFAPGNY